MSDTTVPFPQKSANPANSAAKRFTVGQVVWLRSGSPALTVSGLHTKPGTTSVDWFDVDHMACRDTFDESQLVDRPCAWPSSVVLPEVMDAEWRRPKPIDHQNEGSNDLDR